MKTDVLKWRAAPLLGALAAATLMSACAPLLIGGAVVGSGLVATDRRTTGIQIEDEGIELRAASRIRWYSRSVKVCAGATVIESPVWTPIGSRFSIEQITTKLSCMSRITSSSYSFHPTIDSSIRTSRTLL